MATPRFLDLLAREGRRLTMIYPDLEPVIITGMAIVVADGVAPIPEAGAALIADEPGSRLYHFVDDDGCPCPTGQTGAACSHLLAMRLQSLVMQALDSEGGDV